MTKTLALNPSIGQVKRTKSTKSVRSVKSFRSSKSVKSNRSSKSSKMALVKQKSLQLKKTIKNYMTYRNETISLNVRCHVYKFLPVGFLISTISKVSKRDRLILIKSQLIDQTRSIRIKIVPEVRMSSVDYLLQLANHCVEILISSCDQLT